MFHEKDFEDIISKYPELLEENLTFIGRQVHLFGRIMDLLFEDQFKRKLIIELKIGPIKDQHIGQIMSYEGMLLSSDDPTIRVMLVGNRVPPNIQRTLDHHGIAWKEITYSCLKKFLSDKEDELFLNILDHEEYTSTKQYTNSQNLLLNSSQQKFMTPDDLIEELKSSENYKSFKTILKEKIDNEAKARSILIENLGNLTHNHINEIIGLVDKPYQYSKYGKIYNTPWFGRLLLSNTADLFKVDQIRLNNWFSFVSNNNIPLEKKIDLLLSESYKISGLNMGFITLILYILDKETYSVWFEGLHEGLRYIYPELGSYRPISEQYLIFNESAKKFAKQYAFESTELDWIFSTGFPGVQVASYKIDHRNNTRTNISHFRQLQLHYWTGLNTHMKTRSSFVKLRNPSPNSWSDISLGMSDIYLTAGINSRENSLNIWLVLRGQKGKSNFDKLFQTSNNDSIVEISPEINWDRMEGRKSCTIKLTRLADFSDRNDWDRQFEWFKEYIEKYVRFFNPRIRNLKH